MKEEIEFLRKLLQDDSVPLVTPIGHITPEITIGSKRQMHAKDLEEGGV